MASRAALLVLLNILFFTMVSSSTSNYDVVPSSCPPAPEKIPSSHEYDYPNSNYSKAKYCPKDTLLKLGVCADVLSGLLHVVLGIPHAPNKAPCCPLIDGLVDLDAALCLCTAIKANVLGINLNAQVSLTLLLNHCGKHVPSGFQCA